MIEDLKPYPEMKDSGVEWLGRVPVHWEVSKLGAIGSFTASGIDKNTVEGEPLVRMVNYLDIYNNSFRVLENNRDYQVVSCPEWKRESHAAKKGDLFFTPSSETPEDIALSVVCTEELENTVYSYHTLRYRTTDDVDLHFKKHWCNNMAVLSQFSASCKGTTRQILTRNDFRTVWVPLPPMEDQVSIARFLDHTDRQILRYVRAKQILLAHLEELKQAIVHQAVTGQIDVRTGKPYPTYKSSGVEWLEDVPEHWEVRRLKQSATLIMGQSPSSEDCSDVPIGPPFLQGCAEFGAHHPNPVQYCHAPAKLSPVGAILISVRAPVGRLNMSDQEYGIGRGLCAILPDNEVLTTKLAQYQLEVLGHGLNMVATGSTYDAVSMGDVGNHLVILPTLTEQNVIVDYLDKTIGAIDTAINCGRNQIRLVQDYHTRLIADVVTGKLDVRNTTVLLSDVEQLDVSVDVK